MRKSSLTDVGTAIYKIALYYKQQNHSDVFSFNQERLSSFLKIERKTVKRNLYKLIELGLVEKLDEQSNIGFDGKARGFKWNLYKIEDFLTYEFWIQNQNENVPSYKECFTFFVDFQNYASAYSDVKKEEDTFETLTTKEITEKVEKKYSSKADVEREKSIKLCEQHKKEFDVTTYINRWNTKHPDDQIHYLDGYLRAVSETCFTPNPERSGNQERLIKCAEKFGCEPEDVMHRDMPCSIGLISKGLGRNCSPDLYSNTYKEILMASGLVDGEITDDEWKILKPWIKVLILPIYQKPGSFNQRFLLRYGGGVEKGKEIPSLEILHKEGKLNAKEEQRFMAEENLMNYFAEKITWIKTYMEQERVNKTTKEVYRSVLQNDLIILYDALQQGMKKVFNMDHFLGKHIFLFESDLYRMIQCILDEDYGIYTDVCYDCFYYDGKAHPDFDEIYDKVFEQVFNMILSSEKVQNTMNKKYRHTGEWKELYVKREIKIYERKETTFDKPFDNIEEKTYTEEDIREIYRKADELEARGEIGYY